MELEAVLKTAEIVEGHVRETAARLSQHASEMAKLQAMLDGAYQGLVTESARLQALMEYLALVVRAAGEAVQQRKALQEQAEQVVRQAGEPFRGIPQLTGQMPGVGGRVQVQP